MNGEVEAANDAIAVLGLLDGDEEATLRGLGLLDANPPLKRLPLLLYDLLALQYRHGAVLPHVRLAVQCGGAQLRELREVGGLDDTDRHTRRQFSGGR